MNNTRARTRAVIVWCAVLGIAAMGVGGYDAVEGSAITVRLVGALVLAAGVILIAGAFGLRGGQPRGRALAMIAALLGVLLGVMISLTQVANDEPDGRLALWATIIVLSALAAYQVRTLRTDEDRAKGFWSQLPILKSAISLGVVVSIGQFWYSSIYLPTTAPATATLETKIDRVSESGGELVVSGTVTIRSNSDARINVLASVLELTGERFLSERLPTGPWRDRIRQSDESLGTQIAERFQSLVQQRRIYHQRLVQDGFYLDPDEVITVPVLTRIPKNRFDTLVLDAYLATARGKVLALENATPEPGQVDGNVVVVTPVPNDGLLQDLTRGERFLRVEYHSNPNFLLYPGITFSSDRSSNPPADFDERLQRFYGTGATFSQAYVPLPR